MRVVVTDQHQSQHSVIQNQYRQVKNADPRFTPPEDKSTLPFCEKLMKKAAGFTLSTEYQMLVAQAKAHGFRKRFPPELRRRAIEAALQALCFYYNPLANRVGPSITTMAVDCGLATEKKRLSITRMTGPLQFLANELKVITYNTEYDADIGCNIPTDITFTPLMFEVLDVSEEAVAAARRSRSEWDNLQREKKGMPRLGIDEQISNAWRFVRERFREYHRKRRDHGIKRFRARKDTSRTRKDIEILVRKQLTKEIADRRFTGNLTAVKTEIERRVKERMKMRNNYTRLATSDPVPI